MKSPLAHLSPTVLALGAAIGLSLSLLLLSGAGLQGGVTPLLPSLGGAADSVAAKAPRAVHPPSATPAPATIFTPRPAAVETAPVTVTRPAAQRVHRAHHAPARARVVRPARPAAPSPSAPVAVAAPAPAPPVSAPQPVSAPNGKALGHQRGHAAAAPVAGAPGHGNGHARGHQRGDAAQAAATGP